MKNFLTTLLLALIYVSSYSQITVTDTYLLNIGDVIYQSEDYNTQINIGPTGQGQVWDFSQLNSDDNWNMNVINPNNSPYVANYPTADVCIMDDGEFMYATRNSNGIHILGSGDSILQNPLLVIPLPLTYGASFTDGPHAILDSMISDNLNMLLPIWFGTSLDTLAFFITNGQAHTPDTLQIQTNVIQNFLVDADGEIALPMGTFDCVRLSKEMIYTNSVNIYFTDTLTGINSGWYPIPGFDSDIELVYGWFSNDPNANFSLLEVGVDSLGNQNGSIVFLDGVFNCDTVRKSRCLWVINTKTCT